MYVNAPSENHFERNGVYVPIRITFISVPPKRAFQLYFYSCASRLWRVITRLEFSFPANRGGARHLSKFVARWG